MAGELIVIIAAKPSVGVRLNINRGLSNSAGVLAWMIVILVIGVVVDALLVRRPAERAIRRRRGLLDAGAETRPRTARHDDAVRALVELAEDEGPLTSDELAERGAMPHRFLWAILGDLARAEVVLSQRGMGGGYRLARPPRRSPWPT